VLVAGGGECASGRRDAHSQATFGLRFRAYGRREYITLGTAEDGWTRTKAQTELQNVLADVRRGIWRPADPTPKSDIGRDPTFHEFSSRWFESTKGEWRKKTQLDYKWQLSNHLLPFFKNHHLSQITIAEVDRYRQAKVAEARAIQAAAANGQPLTDEYVDKRGRQHRRPRRALSVASINKTITRLGQILEVAVEYGLIAANSAKGRRRRLKPQKAPPVWLDRPEHIEALLDATGDLDRHAKVKGGHNQKGGLVYRRALLATLVFAGLRIGELTALRWRDVDLAGNRLTIGASRRTRACARSTCCPCFATSWPPIRRRLQISRSCARVVGSPQCAQIFAAPPPRDRPAHSQFRRGG
jgi:integrase